ncbi:MAG: peptide chain release factor N(5)-glutamine methyltransferase [Planctomycetota bacterium]|jgi:release factor glutamine methyltransferase
MTTVGPTNDAADATTPSREARSEAWTTRRLISWITGFLEQRSVDSPRVVAEMLLATVFDCDRMRLYMEIDRPATADERERLRVMVARAGRHEPVHYLVGEASFYWRSFQVAPCTLIPQPSTETLVDHVLATLRSAFPAASDPGPDGHGGEDVVPGPAPKGVVENDPDRPLVADIGTGTGCIAISLAAHLPTARVVATDVIPETLQLAARNAARHGVAERVELVQGSLLAPLEAIVRERGVRFDAICSNPPYVPDDEIDQMDPSVREHVPRSAWSGGRDGLDLVAPLVRGAPALLEAGGLLAVEIAHVQHDAALELVGATGGLVDGRILADHEGLSRVLVARREG